MKKDDVIAGLITLTGILTILLTWLVISQFFLKEHETLILAGVGLIGAILGGTISGAITLIGVRMTIIENNKYDQIKQIPLKVEHADFLCKNLESYLSQSLNDQDDGEYSYRTAIKLQRKLDEEQLLMKSINVNYKTYMAVKDLKESLKFMRLPSPSGTLTVEQEKVVFHYIQGRILFCLNLIEKEKKKMIENIS